MSIHPTAIIDGCAEIAATAEIGPYAVIEGPVRIAEGTRVGPHVHISGHTEIGRNCRIHAGAVIGDTPQDFAYRGGVSYCRIGHETEIREHVTIHRGSAPESATTVGDRCLLMVGAHVGHNCQVANEVILVNGALLGGYVEIGNKVIVSGNAAIHQFVRVGELAIIGGLAKITQDVLPYFMVNGQGECVGINRIGMRRAQLRSGEIEDAKRAYQILCRQSSSFAMAVQTLQAVVEGPAGRQILQFVSAHSRRGFHLQPAPRNRPETAAATAKTED